MKKYLIAALGMLLIASLNANAQKGKAITPEDKKAIIELFKGVNPKLYHLQFNNKKEVYGKKKVTMAELRQAQTIRNPMGTNGYVVLAVRDDGVMFILAVTGKKITDILGAEKAAQLNAIMAKYAR